jgi:hypothetical protein
LGLADVEPCPDVQAELPDLSYDREGATDPASWAWEGDEEAIPGRVDLVAPVSLELLPDGGVVAGLQPLPPLITEFRGHVARTDDVREKEGY